MLEIGATWVVEGHGAAKIRVLAFERGMPVNWRVNTAQFPLPTDGVRGDKGEPSEAPGLGRPRRTRVGSQTEGGRGANDRVLQQGLQKGGL